MKPIVVYIAGPYRSRFGKPGIIRNIIRARRCARKLWRLGFFALCPHSNTGLMDGAAGDDVFLEGGLELLRRCDVMIVLSGFESSNGTLGEINEAHRQEIPVFYDMTALINYYESHRLQDMRRCHHAAA